MRIVERKKSLSLVLIMIGTKIKEIFLQKEMRVKQKLSIFNTQA
jgi:hypothetical protein